ncbi:hypothetical protein FRZ06_02930 [Anoxybacterium hadale]|uniref:Uncharacterized protein n=1 Tax=Anoxybacterium hadale TaxID=3408580 RepID=A0ACD1A7R7_9FIRM|nr:hypothetical protein FRZ06_02930 [Clostridiales bacterium]
MKKILAALLIFIFIISLGACNRSNEDNNTKIEEKNGNIEVAMGSGGDVLAWPLAYNIKEILGEHLFMADGIPETMAVYKNKYVTDGAGVPLAPLTENDMLELGNSVADRLGENIIEVENGHNNNYLRINCEGIEIYVSGNGNVSVEFNKSFKLPMEIDGCRESYITASNYVSEELKPLLELCGIENPTPLISHDYTFNGKRSYNCNLVDADDSFSSVGLYFENGFLYSITWDSYKWSSGEVVGKYPTISYNEAKELLLEGQYYSIVPLEEPINESDIVGAVIGYKTQCYDEVFMPFYAFYVDVTDRSEVAMPSETIELGLKNYATYIVPTIEAEYLKDFPEIVVHFN